MSSLVPIRRKGSRLAAAIAAATVVLTGGALAQTGGAPAGGARVQQAYAAWRNLPQTEVNCVDRALQRQRSNLWTWIQRGVAPTDPSVAGIRSSCGAQVVTPNAQAQSALAQADARKAATEKAAADKVAAEKKAAAEKAAAAKFAAEKAASEKAAEEKLAAEKAAAEKEIGRAHV